MYTMYLTGIGTLIPKDEVWRLTYAMCGHVQELPRDGLEAEYAAAEVRRDYSYCLLCARSESRRVGGFRLQLRDSV
jgi:hypothetical protein